VDVTGLVSEANWAKLCNIYDIVFFYRDFGDLHKHSIDEPYYRSAVLQHEIDPNSYVFSVPFDAGKQQVYIVKVALFIRHTFKSETFN
jgi:hypothetical protein